MHARFFIIATLFYVLLTISPAQAEITLVFAANTFGEHSPCPT